MGKDDHNAQISEGWRESRSLCVLAPPLVSGAAPMFGWPAGRRSIY